MSRAIPVALGARAYEVHVGEGLLARAGALIAPFASGGRVVVVADTTVARLHGPALFAALDAGALRCAGLVEIAPGESSKSFAQLERVCDALLALELERGDLLIALGGGVAGDLAGFAAAIYKRGLDFVQVPTTLLAQVDSSVGGKTAIDTPRGKNMIGAFHQPRLVLADVGVLTTLPDREMRAGFAEMLKHGLLTDADYFESLRRDATAVLAAREAEAIVSTVARSVEIKADVVAQDEREGGRRALLNLGHTFGHAWETESLALTEDDARLIHGEAVALGCCQALRFSASQDLCPPEDARRAEEAFAAAGLPTRPSQLRLPPVSAERLLLHMAQDKKARGGGLTLVLARRIGEAFVASHVDRDRVRDFLRADGAV